MLMALMYKRICLLVACTSFCLSFNFLSAQNRYELSQGWMCSSVSKATAAGTELSQPSYPLDGWLPAVVPGTVLTTMLRNKQIPDPFYGMNNQQIPDIYTTGREYYTYWFAKEFTEQSPLRGQQVWLQFRGVNYSCDVYLNGRKLNDSAHRGMFLRQEYNITAHIRPGRNRLAVIVYPPDPVGNPNGGQGGDGTIAKNVSHQYVAGWDWIQPIRDRNTGIWDKVFIEKTGMVNIRNPHLVTLVPDIRKPQGPQQPATIRLSAELENSGADTVVGKLQYRLNGTTVAQPVRLAPHTRTVISMPDHTLQNPKLWWPNGYGRQDMYTIELQFLQAGRLSDKETIPCGVREIRREWNGVTSSSQFSVNGQKIFLKGGNWIVSDAMLRLSRRRYDAEIRFHRDMNLNLIRVWGGALLERPEFYEACDKYGLLVFQDFWMSGDCNGRWNDRMKLESREVRRLYPDDHSLFLRSVADGIRLIRNHPSLAIWCGGNEITPPDDILRAMKDTLLPQLDGTRTFFDYSNSDSMSANILHGGGDGPYNIQPIDTFWKFRTYPFNSELGSVGLGDLESLQRFIPPANLSVPPQYTPATGGTRPIEKADSVWQYHKYIGYEKYIGRYGAAADVKDFARKAQLVNYDQYRALMEGFSAHMWQWYTGTIIWKTQNPWTALRGQMYDYYLDPNACLYGLRKGSEPVHIMYNPVEGTVMAVNNGFAPLQDLSVTISVLDMAGRETVVASQRMDVPASGVASTPSLKEKISELSAEKGAFLLLKLQDASKQQLQSENMYWLADKTGQYSGLSSLPAVALQVDARKKTGGMIEVTLTNKTEMMAFFNRISLVDGDAKKRVLPVFYSDNYVSVMPGGQKKMVVWYDESVGAKKLLMGVEGWNVAEHFFGVQQ